MTGQTQEQLYISVKGLAYMLGLTRAHIRSLKLRGKLPPSIKIGNTSYWKRIDIINWLDSLKEGQHS